MSSVAAKDYERKARSMGDHELRDLWLKIQGGKTGAAGWAAGKALEYFVLRAFQLDGAKIRWPYEVRLDGETVEQIDGVIHQGPISVVVETKDQQDPANVEPLAKLRSQLLRRPAGTIGMVVSKSGFTSPARTLAGFMAPTTILLWEGAEIDLALESKQPQPFRRGLDWKYRLAVEEGAAFSDLSSFLNEARAS